jgi:(E)-4-hydroxy-3-methylbut-2-enyl-diphosphate synthase
MNIAQEIEKRLSTVKSDIHLAIMGCMVNGPGEAKEAEIGLACGKGKAALFKGGKVYRQLEEKEIVPEFVKEVKKYEKSRKKSKA